MGGLNLEVFKFGMYVMFPIGIMYYFGTNLDNRFAVPDFWPKPEHANKLPTERDEIHAELERLRARRLYLREKRLAEEAASRPAELPQAPVNETPAPQPQPTIVEPTKQKGGWFW
jgi:protein PET100